MAALTADLSNTPPYRPWSLLMSSHCRWNRWRHGWFRVVGYVDAVLCIHSSKSPPVCACAGRVPFTDLRLPPRASTARQILKADAPFVVYKATTGAKYTWKGKWEAIIFHLSKSARVDKTYDPLFPFGRWHLCCNTSQWAAERRHSYT